MFIAQVSLVINSLAMEIVRLVTGRLFSEKQIISITSDTVGRPFADFFPTPEDQRAAKDRIDQARVHIESAGQIISQMQQELSQQAVQLDTLLAEVEEKQKLAEKYGRLAEAGQKQFQAFREEMEEALRKELREHANRGRRLRQAASLGIWLLTLVLGAWLGTYFRDVEAWLIGFSS